MKHRKSRAYYQYMLDLCDKKVSYYSTDDMAQIIYDLLDDGDTTEAMAACQKGLDQHPGDEYLELIEAKILVHMHRYGEAKQLLRDNPDEESPFGIGIQFGIDVATGDQDAAFASLHQMMTQGTITPMEWVDIVDELFDTLPHDTTAIYLQQAAEWIVDRGQKPDEQDAEALGRIGALLMDSGCHQQAVPVLERALDVDAYDIYSWQDLIRCQFDLQRYDECRQSCEMGLAVDPSNPLFHFALGYILFQNNDNAGAIEHLEQARQYAEGKLQHEELNLDRQEVDQQTHITYELLGNAYYAIGQNDKARECYEVLVHRIPNFAEGYYRLSMLDVEKGDLPTSLQRIDKALQIDPDNVTYVTFRVTILTDMQCYEDALSGISRLVELDPKSKTYLLAKAEMSLSLKHYDEADAAYRSLLKLKPKDSATREMMRAYFESIGDEEALKKLKS